MTPGTPTRSEWMGYSNCASISLELPRQSRSRSCARFVGRHRHRYPAWHRSGRDGFLYVLDVTPDVTVVDPTDGRVVRPWGRQGAGKREFDVRRPDDDPANDDIA